MDFLISVHAQVEEELYAERLIPHNFATPELLIRTLISFRSFLNDHQALLDSNSPGDYAYYIIEELQRMKDEYVAMLTYALDIFDFEDTPVPYQELRYSLIIGNFDKFIELLKSMIASVPYGISKTREGHFHVMVHVILKMLGFDIISEEQTNIGRIDAVIRLTNKICVLEFKFENMGDKSQEALEQIISKDYARMFQLTGLPIHAIGIGFSNKSKNIEGYKTKCLY